VAGCGRLHGLVIVGEWPSLKAGGDGGGLMSEEAEALLGRMLAAIGLTMGDVLVTTIIKCLPEKNALPTLAEATACLPLLREEMAIAQPRIICAMGPLAAQAMLGRNSPLLRLRGQWHAFDTIPLIATFHPAFLLANPEMKSAAWQDLQLLQKKYTALLSEQRQPVR